eukprot:Awhi_evm1s11286
MFVVVNTMPINNGIVYPEPDQRPPGSYAKSCRNIEVSGFTLRAGCHSPDTFARCDNHCYASNFSPQGEQAKQNCYENCLNRQPVSQINFQFCGQVGNDNGQLVCDRTLPVPALPPIERSRVTFAGSFKSALGDNVMENVENFVRIPDSIVDKAPTTATVCARYHGNVYLFDPLRGAVQIGSVTPSGSPEALCIVISDLNLSRGFQIGIAAQ